MKRPPSRPIGATAWIREAIQRHQGQEAAARRGTRPRLHAPELSRAGDRLVLPGGNICDYIAEKWGYDKLLDMIHDFAELKTTPEVIREELGMAPEEFDKQFLAWLDAQTKTTVEHFDEWKKQVQGTRRADLPSQEIR